jgi:hypothetical protein
VLINLAVRLIAERSDENNKVKAMRFEIDYNMSKIKEYLRKLDELHNHVGSSSTNLFLYWFDISNSIFSVTNDMLESGTIYKRLDNSNIDKLIRFIRRSNEFYEQRINQELAEIRNNTGTVNAGQFIAFWKQHFTEQLELITQVRSALH